MGPDIVRIARLLLRIMKKRYTFLLNSPYLILNLINPQFSTKSIALPTSIYAHTALDSAGRDREIVYKGIWRHIPFHDYCEGQDKWSAVGPYRRESLQNFLLDRNWGSSILLW
jgi:hypothetical protein